MAFIAGFLVAGLAWLLHLRVLRHATECELRERYNEGETDGANSMREAWYRDAIEIQVMRRGVVVWTWDLPIRRLADGPQTMPMPNTARQLRARFKF